MADVVRPVRLTRRNVQASGLQKENATTKDMLVRKAAPLQHVRSTLGEISNKSTAQTITIGKGGLAIAKQPTAGISTMKENAQVAKPKVSAVNKTAKPVVEPRVGLTTREKPVTSRPGVLRRITNIVSSTQAGPSTAAAKPKASVSATVVTASRPILRAKQSIQVPKPKEEAPKQEGAPLAVARQTFDVSSFSQAEIQALELIDTRDRKDALSAAEYVKDIYQYLRELEAIYCVPVGYIKQCKHMTYHMRAVLIDWLVGVHRQFKLMPETLYLTVSIFDRYMPTALATPKANLQLVGITSLLVAAKYEEIMCPTIGDCVYVTDNAYNKKQVADMEMKILAALNFNIGRPLPLSFLRRFTKASDATYEDHSTAKYFMELQLVRHEMCHIAPSLQASAALCLSLWLNGEDESTKLKDVWSQALHYFSGYAFPEVEEAVKTLAIVVFKGHSSSLQSVRNKFSSKGTGEVAQFVEGQMNKIKSLLQ